MEITTSKIYLPYIYLFLPIIKRKFLKYICVTGSLIFLPSSLSNFSADPKQHFFSSPSPSSMLLAHLLAAIFYIFKNKVRASNQTNLFSDYSIINQ